MIRPVKMLGKAVAIAALFTFSSCASMGGSMLPAGLTDALGSVTKLTGSVGQFASSLSGGLDMPQLDQLKGYVEQAGNLGGTLAGLQESVSSAAADPLGAIAGKLKDMGGFNVDALGNLPGADQLKAVQGLAGSAKDIGGATASFLEQFGG